MFESELGRQVEVLEMNVYEVPTGHICTMNGEKGKQLEFLSIGDYGKEKNLKADFLGLHKEINGVPHGELLPLSEKWVVTISSQYGCSMNCSFCDVPKVGAGVNATFNDLVQQVTSAVSLHPEVSYTKRLNLHYARMGEPTYNSAVIDSAYYLAGVYKDWGFHPVVSTMMPNTTRVETFLKRWMEFKNHFSAGLQLSINTTNKNTRSQTMPMAMDLQQMSYMMKRVIKHAGGVNERKITLNFALSTAEVDAKKLRKLFDPEHFLCKITPLHNTQAAVSNNIITDGGYDYYYPYKEVEKNLKAEGFDVIVFIPSKEEDTSKITCGNAILAGDYK